MAAHLEHGGQHGAHGGEGAEGGVARCREPAGDGPGCIGETDDMQRQGCGVCAMLSAIGTLLRVPRPGNVLSTLDRRWVPAVALNREMGPVARLPSMGELPAVLLDALPAPHTPLTAADIPHQTGLPRGRMRHALLCMATAEGRMSKVVSISLHHVQDAMQQQWPYAPQPWEESA